MDMSAQHEIDAREIIGYFGPQSMAWRIACEAVLMIGGGRAVLMQLAHPLVAAGVDAYSAYRSDPWRRFQETLMMSEALTFGTRGEAHAAARTINRMHYHVQGQLAAQAGAFAAATPYRAHDPDLLFWVLATLIDTVLSLYPRLVGPLSPDEMERYYQEACRSAVLLGLPEGYAPATLAAFQEYMREMITGSRLIVTEGALRVAHAIMHFPLPLLLLPALWPVRAVMQHATAGLLPPHLREQYGFTWGRQQQTILDIELAGIQRVLPLLPPHIRYLPAARRAWRRTRHLNDVD
jgi:uncharacterized protein (DUF2236 family)